MKKISYRNTKIADLSLIIICSVLFSISLVFFLLIIASVIGAKTLFQILYHTSSTLMLVAFTFASIILIFIEVTVSFWTLDKIVKWMSNYVEVLFYILLGVDKHFVRPLGGIIKSLYPYRNQAEIISKRLKKAKNWSK